MKLDVQSSGLISTGFVTNVSPNSGLSASTQLQESWGEAGCAFQPSAPRLHQWQRRREVLRRDLASKRASPCPVVPCL